MAIVDRVRFVSEAEAERQRQGAERLGPGAWVDKAGALHLSIPEVLAFLGLPDTSQTRDEVTALLKAQFAKRVPTAEVIEQEIGTYRDQKTAGT